MANSADVRARNKVKALMDVFETRNMKRINKMIPELTKEFPNSFIVKAAIGFVQCMLGNKEVSKQICDELLVKPARWIKDAKTLSYVSSTLNTLDRHDLIEKMYSDSFEAYKNDSTVNVSMAHTLFSAYIRSNNYAKQRATANELWKITKDDKYWIWSAVATASQVKEEGESTVLNLAAMMIDKQYIKKGKKPTQQELELLVGIYKKMHKYSDALEVITSQDALNAFKVEFERENEQAKILYAMKDFESASKLYVKLLNQNSDEWSWYKGYLDCAMQLGKSRDEIAGCIHELQEKASVKQRSAYLAEVEVEKRFNSDNFDITSLVRFYNAFATKSSTFYDLKPYLKLLSNEKKSEFLKAIEKEVTLDGSNDKEKIDRIIEAVNLEVFKRALSSELNIEATIETLILKYQEASKLSIVRESSEKKPEDDFLLLAVYYLMDLATPKDIIKAIVLLEYGLLSSPFNFQFRLVLIHLYNTTHMVYGSTIHFDALKVKNIQLDTVTYTCLDVIIQHAFFQDASKIFMKSLKVYLENRDSASYSILDAYKHGSYTQVSEAEIIRDRLELSIQHVVVRMENFLTRLYTESHTHLKTYFSTTYSHLNLPDTREKIDKLYVNYDKDFISTFNLENLPLYEAGGEAGRTAAYADAHQKDRILYMSIVLKILDISVSLESTEDFDVDALDSQIQFLTNLTETLNQHATELEKKHYNAVVQMLAAYPRVVQLLKSFKQKTELGQSPHIFLEKVVESLDAITEDLSHRSTPYAEFTDIMTMFLTRTLTFVHIVLAGCSRLMKVKTTPKTLESIKTMLTACKTDLARVKSSVSRAYETIHNKLCDKNSTENPSLLLLAHVSNPSLDSSLWTKASEKTSEHLKDSLNNTHSVLLSGVNDKIKDLKLIT